MNEVIWNTATCECLRKNPVLCYHAFWITYFVHDSTSYQPGIGHITLYAILEKHVSNYTILMDLNVHSDNDTALSTRFMIENNRILAR